MKNFKNYSPQKYNTSDYQKIEENIYKTISEYDNQEIFVTSLSFEMEPNQYGEEEGSPQNITQVPFEDLLDKFNVFVSDFYDDLNETSEKTCYQEFGSHCLDDIKNLRTIIGKRFYAVPIIDENSEEDDLDAEYYDTVLE